MKKVIILRGLPASGKTTWAKQQLTENPGVYKRVNKDDLRAMLDNGKWSKQNEKLVLDLRDRIILESLDAGFHVIVDDTNLHKKHELNIHQLVKGKAQVEVKEFDIELEEAIKRDLNRPASVGEKVIIGMFNRFLKQAPDKYIPNTSKPRAVIFDVDGTLAEMRGRSPFDWHRVGEDLVKEEVKRVYDMYLDSGYKMIIFTGRDGACEKETKAWLKEHGLACHEFKIRPEGNTEKDSIIKRRMFNEIKDQYNVVAVYDDRDQVVEMWRDLGLQCFQVNYGNF